MHASASTSTGSAAGSSGSKKRTNPSVEGQHGGDDYSAPPHKRIRKLPASFLDLQAMVVDDDDVDDMISSDDEEMRLNEHGEFI